MRAPGSLPPWLPPPLLLVSTTTDVLLGTRSRLQVAGRPRWSGLCHAWGHGVTEVQPPTPPRPLSSLSDTNVRPLGEELPSGASSLGVVWTPGAAHIRRMGPLDMPGQLKDRGPGHVCMNELRAHRQGATPGVLCSCNCSAAPPSQQFCAHVAHSQVVVHEVQHLQRPQLSKISRDGAILCAAGTQV